VFRGLAPHGLCGRCHGLCGDLRRSAGAGAVCSGDLGNFTDCDWHGLHGLGLRRACATTDSLLGVLAYSALAAGLVAASLLSPGKLDLMAYLFGDILVVSKADLALILGGACAVSFLLIWRWRALITTIVSLDLAYAAGYSPRKEQLVLTLALALVVAIAIKVVGALLIGAMLIIPVAAVRPLARGLEAMVLLATSAAVVAALGGLQASLWFETPTGPSIVCTAALMFALPFALRSIFGRG
jgi:zinc transport system permease protein